MIAPLIIGLALRANVNTSEATPPWSAKDAALSEVTWICEVPAGSITVPAHKGVEIVQPLAMESGSEAWWREDAIGNWVDKVSRQRVRHRKNVRLTFIFTPVGGGSL